MRSMHTANAADFVLIGMPLWCISRNSDSSAIDEKMWPAPFAALKVLLWIHRSVSIEDVADFTGISAVIEKDPNSLYFML